VARVKVLHFTDPGCPWAYSARPAHARLRWRYGDQLDWHLVAIGLSENTERQRAAGRTPESALRGWRTFSERFGMPFLLEPKPRLAATSRACRALVAVCAREPARGDAALLALQTLQFASGSLLDDDAALKEALAAVEGVDAEAAVAAIDSPETIAAYDRDRALTRSADGSPTHAQNRHSTSDGPVRYTAPSLVFEHEDGRRIEAGGFQPFEAYDLVLANLDPTLERRPAPEHALEALEAFPDGLATAEVASLLRPSDLADADHAAAAAELASLAAAGRVTRRPLGQDAVWRRAEASAAAA
jgi:protein-disulfide isomerase-like protein with CxxC motif